MNNVQNLFETDIAMQNALSDTVSRVQEIYKQMMNPETQK